MFFHIPVRLFDFRTLQTAGVSCAAYHAGLSSAERSQIHHQFLADELQVICATVAFGMGIDKPGKLHLKCAGLNNFSGTWLFYIGATSEDVRRIIHWCLPSSMESYTQQSGRAGMTCLLVMVYNY